MSVIAQKYAIDRLNECGFNVGHSHKEEIVN